MGTEAQAAQGAVDLVSILGTAGGSSSVTGLLVYLLTRRNGNGNGSNSAGHSNDRLEAKMDLSIQKQDEILSTLNSIDRHLGEMTGFLQGMAARRD
jgi:hypothetical protein